MKTELIHRYTPFGLMLIMMMVAFSGAVICPASAAVPDKLVETLSSARQAYEEDRSEEAINLYQRVLASGWSSADLYYNLGNACYKAGQTGWAVAYFEEARRLAPRDGDVRHNLKIASARSRDRVSREDPSWFLTTLTTLLDSFAPADMVRLFLFCLWAGSIFQTLRYLTTGKLYRIAHRALTVVLALLIVTFSASALKFYQIKSAPSGVIVSREVQVLSGPKEGETVQFVLHAGTLLHLGREAGPWREVWLSNEMRGWVPVSDLTELRSPVWIP